MTVTTPGHATARATLDVPQGYRIDGRNLQILGTRARLKLCLDSGQFRGRHRFRLHRFWPRRFRRRLFGRYVAEGKNSLDETQCHENSVPVMPPERP